VQAVPQIALLAQEDEQPEQASGRERDDEGAASIELLACLLVACLAAVAWRRREALATTRQESR
jgi:hypothetical protein